MALNDNLADLAKSFLGTAGNQSIGASGYQKLPSGLVIQWGTTTLTSSAGTSGNQAVSYPTPFPTGALGIFPCGQAVATPAKAFIGAQSVDANGFSMRWVVGTAGDFSGGTAVPWIAIGN